MTRPSTFGDRVTPSNAARLPTAATVRCTGTVFTGSTGAAGGGGSAGAAAESVFGAHPARRSNETPPPAPPLGGKGRKTEDRPAPPSLLGRGVGGLGCFPFTSPPPPVSPAAA